MRALNERDAATEQARHRAASPGGTGTSAPHESTETAVATGFREVDDGVLHTSHPDPMHYAA